MKQLIMSIIIALVMVQSVYATDWSIKTELYTTIPSDTERVVQDGYGVQVTFKKDIWYLYLSTDVNNTRFSGQSGFDINLDSIGVGGEYEIIESDKNKVSFFIDIGGYFPRYKDTREAFPTENSEGLWRYMNKELSIGNRAILFKEYSNDYSPAIGGKIGISFDHYWTDNILSGITIKYRFLKLNEKLIGYDDPITHNSWNFYSERDFSGGQVGINLITIK